MWRRRRVKSRTSELVAGGLFRAPRLSGCWLASERSFTSRTARLVLPALISPLRKVAADDPNHKQQNRRGESIRIQLREYEGAVLLDVRKHYTDSTGKLSPTKKGLSIVVHRLPDLAAGIAKALDRACELNLISEGGA